MPHFEWKDQKRHDERFRDTGLNLTDPPNAALLQADGKKLWICLDISVNTQAE